MPEPLVEGLPQPELNDIYLPAGEHKGWPRFESGQGKHLFRSMHWRKWCLGSKMDAAGKSLNQHTRQLECEEARTNIKERKLFERTQLWAE